MYVNTKPQKIDYYSVKDACAVDVARWIRLAGLVSAARHHCSDTLLYIGVCSVGRYSCHPFLEFV